MPMDIEWAVKDNKVYILQARAITTLKNDNEKALIDSYLKKTRPNKSMRKKNVIST